MAEQVESLTLTVEQAAAAIGISRSLAYEAVRDGRLPVIKIGKRLLVPKAALAKLLDGAYKEGQISTR